MAEGFADEKSAYKGAMARLRTGAAMAMTEIRRDIPEPIRAEIDTYAQKIVDDVGATGKYRRRVWNAARVHWIAEYLFAWLVQNPEAVVAKNGKTPQALDKYGWLAGLADRMERAIREDIANDREVGDQPGEGEPF